MPRTRRWLPAATAAALLLAVAVVASTRVAGGPGPAGASGGGPAFGATVQLEPKEHWAAGIDRIERIVGRLAVVRVFQNEPKASILTSIGDRDGIISFRLTPDQVLSGAFDGDFRAFFAAASTRHATWWCYYHEADVAYSNGQLGSLARFQQASTHLALMARATHNRQLHNAVILVGWTANPRSGLTVAQFMPRPDLVDLIAWDDYNGWFTRQGTYGDPQKLLALNKSASAKVGKPFAVAEFGSLVVNGDYAGRAAWITAFSRSADSQGARFVSYYDSDKYGQGAEYRLLDKPSQAAYRAVVGDQNPFGGQSPSGAALG